MGGGYGYGGSGNGSSLGVDNRSTFRPATPNRRGQYSDSVLNELESQNDAQVEGILGKVKTLKNVSLQLRPLSTVIPHTMEEADEGV